MLGNKPNLMSKRNTIAPEQAHQKKSKSDLSKRVSNYVGYRVGEDDLQLDCVSVPKTPEEVSEFFQTYVKARKPCKLVGKCDVFDWDLLKPENIKETLGNDVLQIEKKSSGGFGSGGKRISMRFHEFMDKLIAGDQNLYLTTQYDEHQIGSESESEDEEDHENDEKLGFADISSDADSMASFNVEDMHDDFDDMDKGSAGDEVSEHEGTEFENERGKCWHSSGVEEHLPFEQALEKIKELYQPPLNNIADKLPEQLPFLKLLPQQLNLWVGSSSPSTDDQFYLKSFNPKAARLGLGRNVPGGGSSSGLHHDHADNIYIPIHGCKRFTLFSPADVLKMYTVGDFEELHDSGIINYQRNENAPRWRKLRADGSIEVQYAEFKLESSNTSEEERKEWEDILANVDEQAEKEGFYPEPAEELDPPSFSKVPPSVVHLDQIKDQRTREKIESTARLIWPEFFTARRLSVDLQPGEMLYLPAGWFHEVTSFGSENQSSDLEPDTRNIHIALNYWLLPTTGTVEHILEDSFWRDYFDEINRLLTSVRQRTEG